MRKRLFTTDVNPNKFRFPKLDYSKYLKNKP